MARARWEKYRQINKQVIALLKDDKWIQNPTTDQLRIKLENKFGVKISWPTLNKYLQSLADVGHIRKIEFKKAVNKVRCWTIKGVDDDAENKK